MPERHRADVRADTLADEADAVGVDLSALAQPRESEPHRGHAVIEGTGVRGRGRRSLDDDRGDAELPEAARSTVAAGLSPVSGSSTTACDFVFDVCVPAHADSATASVMR
jgi:hypothetical protein